MGRIKVLLLDDREIIREGLAKLLEAQENIEVVSQCSKVKQALEEVKRAEPDLVLIDSNFSECGSSEATRKINKLAPKVKVAVLTNSKDQKELISAIESGATGYLHKETKVGDFVESIDLIVKGGVVISPQVAEQLGDKLNSVLTEEAQGQTGLSEREVEIVKLLAKGAMNKEIAKMLFITVNTTKVHVKNILGKLGLRNRQQIAAYAVQQGLVTDLMDSEEKLG
ncbi:MAG: response regulator transcription factor [Dehalococcoidia bacterium]|nr:response regulator transcription factor [Dehalococcoidia bacterium]